MAITFNCSSCGYPLRLSDEWAGKQGRCPKCSTVNQIPAPVTVEPVESKPIPAARPPHRPSGEGERERPEPPRPRKSHFGLVLALSLGCGGLLLGGVGTLVGLILLGRSHPATASSAGSGSTSGKTDVGGALGNEGKLPGSNWSALAPVEWEMTFAPDRTFLWTQGKFPNATIYSGRYELGPGEQVTFRFDQPYFGQTVVRMSASITGNQLALTDSAGSTVLFQRTRVSG